MNVILKAENIFKTYKLKDRENHVLQDVNLSIQKGEFLSVMGPSGSGKSTLLYNISGMDKMDKGTIDFAGKKIEALSEKQLSRLRLHKMGFIFQQIHLLKNLSIGDNIIATAFQANKKPRKDVLIKAQQLMEETGIDHLKDNDISQASGGQLQRAAICRALINEPEIIFGDEPTGALNSNASKEVMSLLKNINLKGTTIMLVTHDIKVAAETDRVLFMKDGKIAGEYHNPPDDHKVREQKLANWLYDQGF